MSEEAANAVKVRFLPACLVALALVALAVLAVPYVNTASNNGQGAIVFDDVQLDMSSTALHLTTAANVALPPSVENGLYSGVPLTFVLSFEVRRSPQLWFTKPLFNDVRRYTLTYYELTRHYRVSELHSDTSRNYRSLSSALAGLGEVGALTFELDEQQRSTLALASQKPRIMVGCLNMYLSTTTLPLSLQPLFRSSWKLTSEEYRWPIT